MSPNIRHYSPDPSLLALRTRRLCINRTAAHASTPSATSTSTGTRIATITSSTLAMSSSVLSIGAASPAVIVIQDWWGLVPHVRAVVDRFAEAGFVALAPDFRHGGPAVKPTEPRLMLNSSQMDEAASDIAAAAEYLASRSEVAGKVGCAGFCAGASLALWSATFSERIVATAGFYPRLPWEGMATDWADYADWALARLLASPALRWTAERACDWRLPPADHVATRYEMKRLGDCAPVFLDFIRA